MTHTQTRAFPETTAQHCYDWITAEDVIRLALGAYYACCRDMDELPDDPTGEDAQFNNGRYAFAEDLSQIFELKVFDLGAQRQVPHFDPENIQRLKTRLAPRNTAVRLEEEFCEAANSGVFVGPDFPIMENTPHIHRTQLQNANEEG
jgi:hypothetical protein